jgi:hypothetical protein
LVGRLGRQRNIHRMRDERSRPMTTRGTPKPCAKRGPRRPDWLTVWPGLATGYL